MGDSNSDLLMDIMKDSACEGKVRTLLRLLGQGFDVNHEYPDGSTLLHYASRNNQEAVIRKLLHNGADVDKCDKEGNTAIDIAARGTLKVFFTYSPDHIIKYTTLEQLTQFHEFFEDVKENRAEVISKLSNLNGKDLDVIVNIRNEDGNSLLLIAFFYKHKNIAYQLMDLVTKRKLAIYVLNHLEKIKTGLSEMVGGFDLIGYDIDYNKYFSIISDNNNLNILTAFLTVIERKLQGCYADLLLKACRENKLENVETLIKRARGNLNKKICKEGLPNYINDALTKESQLGNSNFEKVKSIVYNSASWHVLCSCVINTTADDDDDGGGGDSTPLKIALSNDNLNIVKLLVRYGAHLNEITAPSGHACHDFLNDMHEYIKSKGANLHKFDLEADKLVLANACTQSTNYCYGWIVYSLLYVKVWLEYIGKPDNETKLKLFDLCEVDEEIMLQKFIL